MQQLLTGNTRLPKFEGEWIEKNMANDSDLKARIGWQGLTTAEYLESGNYKLVTGTDFKDGKIDWSSCCYVKRERYEQDRNIQLQIGDLLLTKDGTIGKVAYVDQLPAPATLNSGIFVIRPINNSYNSLYFYYVLSSRIFTDFLKKLQAGSTINHLYQKDFLHFSFLTPQIPEQEAIARVLSDIDAEITALEVRLEKAQNLKQAAMQQLLTGKTRLPGFEGEWEVKLMRDLLTYERPDRYIVTNTAYLNQGDIPVLTANKAFILGYTTENFGVCAHLPVIVFDDFTADSKFATVPFKVKSSAIKLLRPKNNRVSLRFLFELMQIIRFPVGEHKRHYISDYQNIELPIPEFEEQLAIESILCDIDTEIAALEQRHKKTKYIKQAMMQELLTGKTRLVTPGGTNVR